MAFMLKNVNLYPHQRNLCIFAKITLKNNKTEEKGVKH